MTHGELKVKVTTIKKLTQSKETIELCDVLLHLISELKDKGTLGFGSKEEKKK